MSAVPTVRALHRVPVLLGGTGLASPLPAPQRNLALLLRPLPCLGKCMGLPCATCRAGG